MGASNGKLSSQLRALQTQKTKFVVLIKWHYPFFTRLENLQKPNDCALIGVFAEQLRDRLFPGYERFFDLVVWYKANYDQFNASFCDSGCIEEPAIDEIVRQIVAVLPNDQIELLDSEEAMIDVVCRLRAKYSIPGPRLNELEVLRDKGLLKRACEEKGIPTARFMVVDFREGKPVEELLRDVERKAGPYPLFKKPVKGYGSGGCGPIKNREEMVKWLGEMSGTSTTYLVEECIYKPEFFAMVVLLADGTWAPLFTLRLGNRTIQEAFDEYHPIPSIAHTFEDSSEVLPGLSEFVDSIIGALKPPAPHVFCIQAFQLEPKSNKYLMIECAYRLNSAGACALSYKAGGVSQESAYLCAHMDTAYRPKPDPMPLTTYTVSYAPRPGVLQSHSELPPDAPIASKTHFKWHSPVGANLDTATCTNHLVVSVELQHEDRRVVERDLQYLMDCWRPDIA